MKRLVIGILAHVDSGKTTLSEAMLYRAGALRKLGRVDHRNAFLDTGRLGAGQGHHHFFQAGGAKASRHPADSAGHPRPRGLLRRGGAGFAGDGLRHFGGQRHRRGAEPHGNPVAAAGALSRAGVPVCQQDGLGRGRQGRPAGGAAPAVRHGLPGFERPRLR